MDPPDMWWLNPLMGAPMPAGCLNLECIWSYFGFKSKGKETKKVIKF